MTVGAGEKKRTWTVVAEIAQEKEPEDYTNVGVKSFDFRETKGKRLKLMELLMHLWPGDWNDHLQNINNAIRAHNKAVVSSLGLFFE